MAGMTNAEPRPITARVAISWSAEVANVDANDAPPKIVKPTTIAPFLPKRSPRAPAVSSKPANTNA
ncbi:MAG: hypothetical protein M3454_01540 [Actinomycetota bacterium]|nr:hypothetical protein [Actinomycetota bacterium]